VHESEGKPPRAPLTASSLQASLTVADLERSHVWYRDVLGFDTAQKYERNGRLQAVSLVAGDVRILLAQDDGAKGGDRVKGEGFSLMITTAQDIDALASAAKSAGAVLATEPMDAFGARVFRLSDPDGFRLVISSPRGS
jgi:uncharacterized glyoxalase superfamily protein PhnB